MNQTANTTRNAQLMQSEISHLQEELQVRDQLVQQLSQELFRLVKGNAALLPPPDMSEHRQQEMSLLTEQLHEVEQQVEFYQQQIATRDQEVYQLRQSTRELTERSRVLEKVVEELPNVYRQKFAERLAPLREKLEQLQRENRQLHAELQSISYRLAVKNRRQTNKIDLPDFVSQGTNPIPNFGGV